MQVSKQSQETRQTTLDVSNAHLANRWLGDINVVTALPVRLRTLFVLSVGVICIVVFAAICYWTRIQISGELQLSEGLIAIVADKPGTLIELKVRDGAFVKEGSTLARLQSSNDASGAIDASRDLKSARHKESIEMREEAKIRTQGEHLIKAPTSGIVVTFLQVGESVMAGGKIAEIESLQSELEAVMQVPRQAVGSVVVGSEILLRVDAFPYQRFGLHRATVSYISGAPEQGTESRPLFRVRAKLESQDVRSEGNIYAFKAGMKVDSFVIGDYRSTIAAGVTAIHRYLSDLGT